MKFTWQSLGSKGGTSLQGVYRQRVRHLKNIFTQTSSLHQGSGPYSLELILACNSKISW